MIWNGQNISFIAAQSDGRILIGGRAQGESRLARYTPDGALDVSYGHHGSSDGAAGIHDAMLTRHLRQLRGRHRRGRGQHDDSGWTAR